MTGDALRAALIDLAEFGIVLVKHEWEADEIVRAAPVATRARSIGGMWAVEVVRVEKAAVVSGCES